MANPSIEFFTRRGLAIKAETTEGTDSSPSSSTNSFQIMDGRSGIVGDPKERPLDRPHLGHDPFLLTNVRGFIEGSIELVPPETPGTDAAAVAPLLLPCGMAQTLVTAAAGPPVVDAATKYDPISSSIPTVSAYFWHAGTLKKLLGARGNITGLSMSVNDFFRAQFRLEGSCNDITETALPSDFDFSDFATPVVATTANMELKINSFAVQGLSLALDFGNEMGQRVHTEATTNRIKRRRPTWTCRFFRTLKSDLNVHSLWKAGTIVPLVATLNESDLRYSRFAIRGQIESIDEVDDDGDYCWEIKGRAIASDTGGDEFGVAFGEVAET